MNISKGCTRLIGAGIAIAALSTPLAACATSTDTKEALTVADLQPLAPEDEYAEPYNLKAKVGDKCTLVTYSYQLGGDIPVMQRTVYEYVLYGPDKTTEITKSRNATREYIEGLMNNGVRVCFDFL